jgi:hypothetical protein
VCVPHGVVAQTQYEAERAEFLLELRKHIDQNLYRKTSAAAKSEGDYHPGGGGGGPPGLLGRIFGKKNQIAAAADSLMDNASDALDQGIDAVGTVAGGALNAANQLSAATVGVSADMAALRVGTEDGGGGGGKDDSKDDALGATKTGGKDDLMSQLAIETYFECKAHTVPALSTAFVYSSHARTTLHCVCAHARTTLHCVCAHARTTLHLLPQVHRGQGEVLH